MKLHELQNKKILILGYGKEGQATEAYLKKYVPSATLVIADQSTDPDYLEKQNDVDIVIKTPGILKNLITKPYTTATNLFFANNDNLKIGVTGTKGKSTTTSLIYEMLKEGDYKVHLVGNIGNPMLAELMDPVGADDIFICELSSYQLDDIKYSPHVSVIVSLFPEHMNYHGSIEEYYDAKKNIIKYSKANDYYIYNKKFPILVAWAQEAPCMVVPFEARHNIDISKTSLIGEHNEDNIKAAITVAKLFHVSSECIKKALQHFKPLPHRLEKVGEYRKITFYDDAISTTPESTIAAIKALKNVGTIFLGGQNRGYDFRELKKVIDLYDITNIVLFPESGTEIRQLLEGDDISKYRILETDNMKDAVEFAYQHTPEGMICLLSTASPSYTLWKNFEAKGDEFQKWVRDFGTNPYR